MRPPDFVGWRKKVCGHFNTYTDFIGPVKDLPVRSAIPALRMLVNCQQLPSA